MPGTWKNIGGPTDKDFGGPTDEDFWKFEDDRPVYIECPKGRKPNDEEFAFARVLMADWDFYVNEAVLF